MIAPDKIQIDFGGMLTATLGHAESEFVAALIIRWHHVRGLKTWTPISRLDIAHLLQTDGMVQEWAKNPFWRPVPIDFANRGFIVGWNQDPDNKGALTDKFHAGIAKRFK